MRRRRVVSGSVRVVLVGLQIVGSQKHGWLIGPYGGSEQRGKELAQGTVAAGGCFPFQVKDQQSFDRQGPTVGKRAKDHTVSGFHN